jgi:hypothetical protein
MQVTIEPAAEFREWLAGQLNGRKPQAASRRPD